MRMLQTLSIRCSQSQKLTFPAFVRSALPKTDAVIEALRPPLSVAVANLTKQRRYRDEVDFVLCFFFAAEYERPCRLFYEGRGKPLVKILDADAIERLDAVLSEATKEAFGMQPR